MIHKIIMKIKNLEVLDKFTLCVLVFGTLYIGGQMTYWFRHEIIAFVLAGLWAIGKICSIWF